jgi:hypothetical protein
LVLKKIYKVDKPLVKLKKRQRQTTQITELDKFQDAYDLPKLNKNNINHPNTSIPINEIEVLIKSLLKKKIPGPNGLSVEFFQTFKKINQCSSNYYMK